MSAHTILAVVSGDTGDRAVLDTAVAVAAPELGVIDALHVKADPREVLPLLGEGISMAGEVIAAIERDSAARAAQARAVFDQWSGERKVTVQPTDTGQTMGGVTAIWREVTGRESEAASYLGRNADLLVLARREDMPGMGTIEACVFNSGRPVLLAPATVPTKLGRHIGVFWNGSCQAARAVGDAMELLRQAERVTVYTTGAEGPAPTAGELARRLSRVGITTLVDMVSPGVRIPAEALMTAAERDGIDLIVMGGYGHGRFREMILGGVTRAVIETGRTAVLLAH
jgi:nucleotide-binding universal stress UspA family protein